MLDGQGGAERRERLLLALERELRRMTGQSVLLSHAVAERLGMHPTDLECLGFLVDEGPVPAGRLAEVTGLTSGAVTRMIDRLERAGYVSRQADPRDRRRVLVQLDLTRIAAVRPLYEGLRQAMSELCARYSDAELALILDFISRAGTVGQEQVARLRSARSAGRHQAPVDPPA